MQAEANGMCALMGCSNHSIISQKVLLYGYLDGKTINQKWLISGQALH